MSEYMESCDTKVESGVVEALCVEGSNYQDHREETSCSALTKVFKRLDLPDQGLIATTIELWVGDTKQVRSRIRSRPGGLSDVNN